MGGGGIGALGDDGQGEVVTVAACVVGLEVIGADGDDRAIGQVAEGACNRGCGGVVEDGEGKTLAEGSLGSTPQIESRVATNRNSVGHDLVTNGCLVPGFEGVGVSRVVLEEDRTLNGECGRRLCAGGWREEGACSIPGADGGDAGDRSIAAQGSALDRDYAVTCARASLGVHRQSAAADGSAAGIGIGAAEGECAGADLDQSAAGAASDSGILDDSGEGGAQIIAADGERLRPEKDGAVTFHGSDGDAGSEGKANVERAITK